MDPWDSLNLHLMSPEQPIVILAVNLSKPSNDVRIYLLFAVPQTFKQL